MDDWHLDLRPARPHRDAAGSDTTPAQTSAETAPAPLPTVPGELDAVRKIVAKVDAHLTKIDARLARIEEALAALAAAPPARGMGIVRDLSSTQRSSDLRTAASLNGERRTRRLRAAEGGPIVGDRSSGDTAQA